MSSIKKKYVAPQLNECKKNTDTFTSININVSQDIQQPISQELLSVQK
jgi:hypothetical protein